MKKITYSIKKKYLGKKAVDDQILMERLSAYFNDPKFIIKKHQKRVLINHLNQVFWELGGLDSFENQQVYKDAIPHFEEALTKGHTLDSMRLNLQFQNQRNEEFIEGLISKKTLESDTDNPPSYYLKVNEKTKLFKFTQMLRKIGAFVMSKWIEILVGLTTTVIGALIIKYFIEKS